jgi:peroxiredoxin
VGADPSLSVIKAYDAKREKPSQSGDALADRISYVIGPDGKVLFALTDSNPTKHVQDTLAFIKQWREQHPR